MLSASRRALLIETTTSSFTRTRFAFRRLRSGLCWPWLCGGFAESLISRERLFLKRARVSLHRIPRPCRLKSTRFVSARFVSTRFISGRFVSARFWSRPTFLGPRSLGEDGRSAFRFEALPPLELALAFAGVALLLGVLELLARITMIAAGSPVAPTCALAARVLRRFGAPALLRVEPRTVG